MSFDANSSRRGYELLKACGRVGITVIGDELEIVDPFTPDQIKKLIALLKGKISDEDLTVIQTELENPGAAMDARAKTLKTAIDHLPSALVRKQVEAVISRGQQEIKKYAKTFDKRFPQVASIGFDHYPTDLQRQLQSGGASRQTGPIDEADFARRFPHLANIGHV